MAETSQLKAFKELFKSPEQNLKYQIPIQSCSQELESLIKEERPRKSGKFSIKLTGPNRILKSKRSLKHFGSFGQSSTPSAFKEGNESLPGLSESQGPTTPLTDIEILMEQQRRTLQLMELDQRLKSEEEVGSDAIFAALRWTVESPHKMSASANDRWIYKDCNNPARIFENLNENSAALLRRINGLKKTVTPWRDYEMWAPQPFELASLKLNNADFFQSFKTDFNKIEKAELRKPKWEHSNLLMVSFVGPIGVIGEGNRRSNTNKANKW